METTDWKKPIYGPVFEWSAKSIIWIPDTHTVWYSGVRYSDVYLWTLCVFIKKFQLLELGRFGSATLAVFYHLTVLVHILIHIIIQSIESCLDFETGFKMAEWSIYKIVTPTIDICPLDVWIVMVV